MVTPLSWLERVPTYKEALEQVKDKDLHNYGFLGYPCLQTADIVIYSEDGAQLYVPVGEDQVSHVELSREIVALFNSTFGINDAALFAPENIEFAALLLKLLRPQIDIGIWDHPLTGRERIELAQKIRSLQLDSSVRGLRKEGGLENFLDMNPKFRPFISLQRILEPPQAMLTKTPRIPGLDGRKMSKSYGNAITLSETDEEIRKKTKVMVTDPARKRRTDPGNPDVCPVYDWHKLFSAGEAGRLEWVRQGCTTAGIGCIECKAAMAEWEKDPKGVVEMIDAGSKKARVEAKKTMERVREAVFGWEKKKAEVMK
jgi:tryptophanyl-tRNA synthetase